MTVAEATLLMIFACICLGVVGIILEEHGKETTGGALVLVAVLFGFVGGFVGLCIHTFLNWGWLVVK